MAIAIRVVPETRSIEVRITGHLTVEDVLAFLASVEADPAYSPDFNAMIDARGVTVDFDTQVLQGLAGHHRVHSEGKPSRWAMIVSEDLTFGMGRMFEAFMDESPREFRVFRTIPDALGWVGLGIGDLTLLAVES